MSRAPADTQRTQVLTEQAPGNAYHCTTAGWFRVTFSVARDDLEVGLGKLEQLLGMVKST